MFYTRDPKVPPCAARAGGVYWPCPTGATDASSENISPRIDTGPGERARELREYEGREEMHRETGEAEIKRFFKEIKRFFNMGLKLPNGSEGFARRHTMYAADTCAGFAL